MSMGANEVAAQVLIGQYEQFLCLYMHEDTLTWSKFNNLLYVNTALAAILGFFIENQDSLNWLSIQEVLWLLAAVGLLVSLAFAVTITFGTIYLARRKEAVERIEEAMRVHGAIAAFHATVDRDRPLYLALSPTRWILRLGPLLFALLWVGVALLPLIRPLS